ncbi:transmembrane protein 194, partial [Tanacetum coccineum]
KTGHNALLDRTREYETDLDMDRTFLSGPRSDVLDKIGFCSGHGPTTVKGTFGMMEWKDEKRNEKDFLSLFRTSTSPEIPSVILDINDQLTQWEYLNSRIDMIGLFLFGPENGRSIIHSVRAPGQPLVDDLQCLKFTTSLFVKHCGCIHTHCLRRFLAFANICNHAVDKAAIKEALAFACGLDRINYVVNVENPTITRIAPAPVRDSEEHCERVSVEGVSRKKLGSFAKMYRVLLQSSSWWWNDEEAQICVHRNASLGLCQCEKDDWRSLENDQWSFVMSPYEQLFVDVKFAGGTHGFVSVYLHEVLQGWRCLLLAIGFSLLFLATVASKCLPSSIATRPLAVRAIASIVIFQSSMDTLFATVAVVTCVTVYILIRLINDPVTWEKRKGFRLPDLRVYGIFLHVSGDLCKFPVLSGSENIGNRKQANLVL